MLRICREKRARKSLSVGLAPKESPQRLELLSIRKVWSVFFHVKGLYNLLWKAKKKSIKISKV